MKESELIEAVFDGKLEFLRNNDWIGGFDEYSQAVDFAEKCGGRVVLFSKKDGDIWRMHGRKYEALTYDDYLDDLGDNYSLAYMEKDNGIIPEIKDYFRNHDDIFEFDGNFEKIETAINNFKEILHEIEIAEKDEVVIANCGVYFETVKIEMMRYHEDNMTFEVGVCIDDFEGE